MPCATKESTTNEHQYKAILDKLPKPKSGLPFQLLKVEDVMLPHPYCITPKHLQWADSMYLDERTIAHAEERGAKCDICRQLVKAGKQAKVLTLVEHEKSRTLFIQVEQNDDLNKVPDLRAYLRRIIPLAEHVGIQGFAFLTAPASEER